MKKKYLFIILFLPTLLLSQKAEKTILQGKITNEKDVEGIHVMNTSSRYNSVTNQYGNFAITVKIHDTLVFSSVHYAPQNVEITSEIMKKGLLIIALAELINELDEVFLGPDLSGNLKADVEKIPVKDPINFDDVGIPGFKGKPEEKIPTMIGQVITPLSVNIEGLYKHLSGYYRKLRLQRKWEGQNVTVAKIIDLYTATFFSEAYSIPENRLYDFLLFCIETSSVQSAFTSENYAEVLAVFETKSDVYLERMLKKTE